MYGAGNIGRGFIGALFADAGYKVTFIDVDTALVDALNRRGQYPLRVLSDGGHEERTVKGVDAVDGNKAQQVAEAIASADIMATAVGANILKFIAANIALGLQRRFERTQAPLDIVICENLMDADRVLGALIKQALPPEAYIMFEQRVGLVEASIGRMVPRQTDEMKDDDPLRVCVERYSFLPVDRAAFKGQMPHVEQLVPYAPFGFYLKRKLYIHNMGHALCAYLGLYTGAQYIWQAVEDPCIRLLAKGAMEESLLALADEYDVPASQLLLHTDDLLNRFSNRALGDTCARVGNDTTRKLAPDDRLVGAAANCMAWGVSPVFTAVGIAAALHRHLHENALAQTEQDAQETLGALSGLDPQDALAQLVLEAYNRLCGGTSPQRLLNAALLQKSAGAAISIP